MTPLRSYADYRSTGTPWLDTAPSHWTTVRLAHIATAVTSTVDKHSVDGQPPVRLCNYTDVYKNDSITADMPFMAATATPEQVAAFRIRRGDTIITKDSETADDVGIPSFVEYEADDLVCGYHLAIIRPDPLRVHPRFLFWALGAIPTLRQWAVLASGVTRVGIRGTDLRKAVIALPPLDEQTAIVQCLDVETSQIDDLVERQNRLISVLDERRRAIVDHAVWRGLDAGVERAPTRVAPAPDVPAHWQRHRNKNLLRERRALSTTGEEELLTVSHLTGITPRSQKTVNMFEAESLEGYRLVEVGDLVINTMWAWMGALGVSSHRGIVSPAYGVYEPAVGDLPFDGRYFDYLYRSRPYITEMTRHSRGVWSSRLRLYPESFLRLGTVVPPLAEQRAIADFLDQQTSATYLLAAKARGFIDLARERRRALVTAVVIGQIDVRDELRATLATI